MSRIEQVYNTNADLSQASFEDLQSTARQISQIVGLNAIYNPSSEVERYNVPIVTKNKQRDILAIKNSKFISVSRIVPYVPEADLELGIITDIQLTPRGHISIPKNVDLYNGLTYKITGEVGIGYKAHEYELAGDISATTEAIRLTDQTITLPIGTLLSIGGEVQIVRSFVRTTEFTLHYVERGVDNVNNGLGIEHSDGSTITLINPPDDIRTIATSICRQDIYNKSRVNTEDSSLLSAEYRRILYSHA